MICITIIKKCAMCIVTPCRVEVAQHGGSRSRVWSKIFRDYISVFVSPYGNSFQIIDRRRDDVYIG